MPRSLWRSLLVLPLFTTMAIAAEPEPVKFTGLPTVTKAGDGAKIDGASKWQIFSDVILPLARPGLITLTVFTFIGNYHSFFWPLVMLRSTHRYTLRIGLLFFDSSQGQQTNLLMAAIAMSVVPMIIVFAVLQKHLVKGIQSAR